MILENYYWSYPSALSSKFCDELVQYGESKKQRIGTTSGIEEEDLKSEENLKKLHKIRNSNVTWINEPWVMRTVVPWMQHANVNADWNFQLGVHEDAQWTKYGKEQHYSWHYDSNHKVLDNPNLPYHNMIRKLSMTISLVDGSEYEGGDFQVIIDGEERTVEQARQKGTITVFPSFVKHRVSPVKKGTRYSLVLWWRGNRFF
jgi:PKHD-type hydroxylase